MFGFRDALWRHIDRRFAEIAVQLLSIERKVEKNMASLQDLDKALDDFVVAQDAANAEVLTAVNDILSKVGTTVDLTAEVDRIHAAQDKMTAAADVVKGLDVTPVPPVVPPVIPPVVPPVAP